MSRHEQPVPPKNSKTSATVDVDTPIVSDSSGTSKSAEKQEHLEHQEHREHRCTESTESTKRERTKSKNNSRHEQEEQESGAQPRQCQRGTSADAYRKDFGCKIWKPERRGADL